MEGSLVRLDAACRDSGTPRVCGNLVLFKQMEAASNLIERDVIFAVRVRQRGSLYVCLATTKGRDDSTTTHGLIIIIR